MTAGSRRAPAVLAIVGRPSEDLLKGKVFVKICQTSDFGLNRLRGRIMQASRTIRITRSEIVTMERTAPRTPTSQSSPALVWSSMVLSAAVLPKATIGQVRLARRILADLTRRDGRSSIGVAR